MERNGVTGRSVLPPGQYMASLARKQTAATAFFRDDPWSTIRDPPILACR